MCSFRGFRQTAETERSCVLLIVLLKTASGGSGHRFAWGERERGGYDPLAESSEADLSAPKALQQETASVRKPFPGAGRIRS